MPKVTKDKKKKGTSQPYSLDEQLSKDARLKPIKKKVRPGREEPEELAEGGEVPKHLKKQIDTIAKAQRAELLMEEEEEEEDDATAAATANKLLAEGTALADDDDDDKDTGMKGGENDIDEDNDDDENEETYNATNYDVQISEEDERALQLFMAPATATNTFTVGSLLGSNGNGGKRGMTLGDVITEKLRAAEAAREREERLFNESAKGKDSGAVTRRRERKLAEQKVREMYKSVGEFLKRYTTGKLPKAFKVLPSLRNWEELMFLTRPDEWSPHAMWAAVRMFVSGMNEKMSQRFFSIVLLPCIRDAIAQTKKLHFALYMALKKALYRPAAFFKGFLLPLCEAGDCTLREAVIVSSVLAKVSIPPLHSAACILKICQMPYAGANSVFLRTLIDKKYSLPFRVIDAICSHFVSFRNDSRKMVVLWHQALLIFVQRYKIDLTHKQKDALRDLIRIHNHPIITPEIRYELDNSASRDTAQDVSMKA